jgi:hypothetical protein
MTDLTWRAYRSATEGGTYTQLQYVQNITMTVGRAKVTDQWRPSVAVIEGRAPGSLPAGLAIGDFIKINNTTVNYDYWFRVADVKIDYDIVTNGDRWQIDCEAALATAGRSTVSASTSAGDETLYVMGQVLTDAPINFSTSTGLGASFVSAITLTDENPIAAVQKLAFTEQAYLADYDFENTIVAFQRGTATAGPFITFTDDDTATTTYKVPYSTISFGSLAENYATGVVINPATVATQTAGTTSRAFSFDSYDNTTSQAANLAGYLDVVLSQNTAQPQQVMTRVKTWSSATPLAYLVLGQQIRVRLRSTNYNCVLEGMTISANPEQTTISCNLSPATAYAFLTLDDAVLGRLDYNALGF